MRTRGTIASTIVLISSTSAPPTAAFAAAQTRKLIPSDTSCESITSIRAPRSASCSAACRALLQVAESLPEIWIETISAPSERSGSYACRKSPGEGADVVGRTLLRTSLS